MGIFIGLDLSLSSTGLCIRNGDSIELETIKSTPKTAINDLERLLFICQTILKKLPSDIDMLCVEDYFTPSNRMQMGAALNLVALGTAMRLALYHSKIPFFVITPPQLKKYVTGSGASPKSIILREVFKRWKVEASDDNQADAAGLSYMAESIFKCAVNSDVDNLTKNQQDVIIKAVRERPHYNFIFSSK